MLILEIDQSFQIRILIIVRNTRWIYVRHPALYKADALQFTLALDGYIANALENLAPYKNTFSLDGIRSISSALEHSKTVVGTTATWMETTDEELEPVTLARMLALPDALPPAKVTESK